MGDSCKKAHHIASRLGKRALAGDLELVHSEDV